VALDPENHDLWASLIDLYRTMGQNEEALEAYYGFATIDAAAKLRREHASSYEAKIARLEARLVSTCACDRFLTACGGVEAGQSRAGGGGLRRRGGVVIAGAAIPELAGQGGGQALGRAAGRAAAEAAR
jgi:hypothetical protein